MAMTAAQVNVKVSLEGADKTAAGLRSLGTETDNTAKKQGFLQSAMSTAVGVLGGGLVLGAIGQMKNLGASALGAGLSFEQGVANIGAVTGATGAELKQLSDLALQIGKDSSFGATEATQAIEELAKAGVSTDSILNGAADGAVALAAAGGVALPEAAAVMSQALNQFGLDGSQATHVADLLAAASSVSATGVTELGASLTYVGATANALGIPIEDTVTALAAMADQGLSGSMAGTALNNALMSMANPTAKAQQAMDELGVSFFDAFGVMKPMPQILSELSTATAGLTQEQRAAYLENIFGVEGARAMNALLATQTDEAKKAGKSWTDYAKSVNRNGAAAEQAAARMDSTMGSIEKLKGSLETLAIIGSMAVLPMFRGLVDGAAHVVDGFTTFITTVQDLIAGGSSPLDAISLAMRGLLTDLFGLDTMNALMPFVNGFLDALEVVGEAIQGFMDLLSGDWESALLHFGNFFQGLGAGIIEAASALANLVVDIAGWVINIGVPAVTGWLADHAGDIWSGVKAITGWVWDGLVDLGSWVINVGVPTLASAGWTLIGKLKEWLFGTAPSDGTGGQGYATSGVLVELGSWTLDVALPTIAQKTWDLAPLILAEIGEVAVTLGGWTLNVAAPNIVFIGWSVPDILNKKLQEKVLIPLHAWQLTLDAPDVVLGFGSLSQWIRSKLNLDTAIDIGKVSVALTAVPLLVPNLIANLPAMLAAEVLKNMPDDVKANFGVTFNLTKAIFTSSIDLGLEVLKFAAVQLAVGLNLEAPLNVTISAINFLGLAADVFNPFTNGLGFKGTIDLIMPDWDWPDLPTWSWPNFPSWDWPDLPSFEWPEIPMPSWWPWGSKQEPDNVNVDRTPKFSPGGGGGNYEAGIGNISGLGRPNITAQFDDGGAAAKIAELKAALDGIPKSTTLSITQVGGEAVAAAAAIAQAAIAALPPSTSLSITQVGAEAVAAASAIAHAAIAAIPTSWTTAISEVGGGAVAAAAAIAHAAIAAIPTSWSTTLSIAGAEAVAAAANAAAAAIAAIPSSKTITISTVTGAARAVGGYVTGGLTRLAELGPELVAMPNGNWFMAMRDALYPTPLGSYVYTAGQTQGMVGSLMPVPAYADGGAVGGKGSAPRGSGSPAGPSVHVEIHGDVYGVDDLKQQIVAATAEAIVDAVATHRRQFGG